MKTLGIILLAIIIIGGGIYLFSKTSNAPTTQNETPTPTPIPEPTPAAGNGSEVEVDMISGAFSPAELTIKTGTTVKFVNKDAAPHWPASGPHPIHTTCPGFDALSGVKPGESYSFTFTAVKECPMHDHLNPSVHGKITVTN